MKAVQPYVRIARPDHWFKNAFMLPGMLVALYAMPDMLDAALVVRLMLAVVAVCLIASSYYVLNEILDAEFDALHPVKRFRPVPSGLVNIPLAYAQWFVLAVAGFFISAAFGPQFLACAVTLWAMSLIYNVRPLRAKDRVYLDVLVESVNNPLRLLLGWYATGIQVLMPISLVAAFWMLGAFFMAVKRFAEYRLIGDPDKAAAYRGSFHGYTEERLLVSATFYAVAFGLLSGIFIIRYRIELLLAVPFIAGAIAWYIHLGLQADSPAQYPERLHREQGYMTYLVLCVLVAAALMYFDMPVLYELFEPTRRLQEVTGN